MVPADWSYHPAPETSRDQFPFDRPYKGRDDRSGTALDRFMDLAASREIRVSWMLLPISPSHAGPATEPEDPRRPPDGLWPRAFRRPDPPGPSGGRRADGRCRRAGEGRFRGCRRCQAMGRGGPLSGALGRPAGGRGPPTLGTTLVPMLCMEIPSSRLCLVCWGHLAGQARGADQDRTTQTVGYAFPCRAWERGRRGNRRRVQRPPTRRMAARKTGSVATSPGSTTVAMPSAPGLAATWASTGSSGMTPRSL